VEVAGLYHQADTKTFHKTIYGGRDYSDGVAGDEAEGCPWRCTRSWKEILSSRSGAVIASGLIHVLRARALGVMATVYF
jgi:hypothetical protein